MVSNPKFERRSIGREAAIVLAQTGWWKDRDAREVAEFQLLTKELCMDFSAFHEAVEKTLGRPVFTHEFGLNYEGLVEELFGLREPPTFDEILALIPKEKLIVLNVAKDGA